MSEESNKHIEKNTKKEIESKTKKQQIKSNKNKSNPNFLKPLIIILVIIVGFYMLTSARKINDAGCTEEKIVQEPTVAEIPYNTTEVYYEKVCGGDEYCKFTSYSFSTTTKGMLENIDGTLMYICEISIENKENISGNWSIHAVFKSDSKLVGESEIQTKEIGANDKKVFRFMIPWEEGKMISCERVNDELPVKKTDCVCSYYKNIKKYRTVTKLRNVTVYKNVTKIVPSGECIDENGEPIVKVIFENRFFKYTQPFYLGY